jgi:hypothetical protein
MEDGTIQNRKERTNMGRDFTQEHIMKLCLPPELYLAVIKFQVQKELGKSYAGLLLVTKAAYQEKLITKEIYEKYLYRYSRKLVPEEEPQKLTTQQQKEKQKLDEKTRTFSILPSQWEIHPDPQWRQRWINEAEKWQDQIPEAKEFLKKVGLDTFPDE